MYDTAPGCTIPRIPDPKPEPTRTVGELTVVREGKRAPLPLAGVCISARVADRIALVTLTETFQNPYSEPLEAVYIFPLAGGSAVSDFEMRVGGRVIKGRVEERGEARRQYAQAIQSGKRAALLEQERDDVFTVQVGNLPPGEEVSVKLVYSERLPFFEEGGTELRLPLVVAPRYIPGAPLTRDPVGTGVEGDTTAVPDASRITPPRLAPGFDPRVSLALEVELVRGAGEGDFADLACSQHATRASHSAESLRIALARTDESLNRDFVLRWRLAADGIRSRLLVHRDASGAAYGMLSLVPPRRDGFLGLARDVVFVLDRSGSMGGVKMSSAARACSLLLATLGPRDRFAVQAFDDRVEWMAPPGVATPGDAWFVPADDAGIARGDRFLRGIDARGGTELDGAMAAALDLVGRRNAESGRVPVIVLLTDGQVGDEGRILKRLQGRVGDTRVFTVGIDTAVNDGFLRRLAALAGGTSTFVEPGVALEEALRAVGREIGAPVVVDLRIEDLGAEADLSGLAPAHVPDLFAGRAVAAFFPLRGRGAVKVSGRFTDGGVFAETVPIEEIALPAIAHLWARARVADLEDRFRLEPHAQAQIRQEIVTLAVRHTLLTRFTAFVVVDESEIVNAGGSVRQVTQPVESPALWQPEADAALPCSAAAPVLKSPAPMPRRTKGFTPPVTGEAQHASPPMPNLAYGESVDAEAEGAAGAPGRAGRPSAPPPPPPAQGPVDRLRGSRQENLGVEKKKECRQDKDPGAPTREQGVIGAALAAFLQAMADVRGSLEAGRLPPFQALEKARAALLAALAGSILGQELPRLQRFLRREAVDLVAALGASGAGATALADRLRRALPELQSALDEATPRLGGAAGNPAPASGGDFWAETI